MKQRIFELFGEPGMLPAERAAVVCREYGVTEEEAFAAMKEVLRDRGTPNLERARQAIDRLDAIIPYI